MERGRRVYAGLVVALALVGASTPGAAAGHQPFDLELRVLTYRTLAPADIDLAHQTAADLLATAGLRVDWRTCAGASCAGPSEAHRVIVVRLLPITKRDAPDTSGEVVREAGTNKPSVLVYVPRNAELTRVIRLSPAGRSHPALGTLALGHLVGLTIAHEIGHSLGLGHSGRGPMKARPDPDDIIAMREGRLRFRATELEKVLRSRPE
jgi:hypothetical protein